MNAKDRRYFRARAEAEIEAAAKTETPQACRAHYELAEAYLAKVYPPEAANDTGNVDGTESSTRV